MLQLHLTFAGTFIYCSRQKGRTTPRLRGADMNSAGAYAAQQPVLLRPAPAPVVIIVDDDLSVRESLEALLFGAGWRVEAFECAEDFLSRQWPSSPSCLILDIKLPRVSGLAVQA